MSKKGKGIIKIVKQGKETGVVLIHPWKMKAAKLEDTALALKRLGDKKKPLHDDKEALEERHSEVVEAVLNDWALFALGLIEAAHRGDHNAFRKIHNTLIGAKEKPMRPEIAGLMIAAAKKGEIPTIDDVVKETSKMGSGEGFTSNQQVKRNLESKGFDVPSKRKGRPKKK